MVITTYLIFPCYMLTNHNFSYLFFYVLQPSKQSDLGQKERIFMNGMWESIRWPTLCFLWPPRHQHIFFFVCVYQMVLHTTIQPQKILRETSALQFATFFTSCWVPFFVFFLSLVRFISRNRPPNYPNVNCQGRFVNCAMISLLMRKGSRNK